MTDLSILIPARNEMFLSRTIEDILENMRGDTEIIAVLDGQWAEPPIPDHDQVNLIYHSEPIGQRAATNEAARMSTAKYVMKCDAHCTFDEGFDVKMMEVMQDSWTMVPIMKNLHAFDWVCLDGHRRYQSPSGVCKECGKETKMDILWIAKPSPQSKSYRFDTTPKFKYFREFNKRPEGKGDLTESMSLQGSCFVMTREKYFELDVCDESFGEWGSMGIEVALKTWLSGGKVMVNHKTWYAHLFRTQGGDFSFPYPLSGSQTRHAKREVRELFYNNRWSGQVKPLSWLIEKFAPLPDWHEESGAEALALVTDAGAVFDTSHPLADSTDSPASSGGHGLIVPQSMEKGIVYYTDNRLDPVIMKACQAQLHKASDCEIVSVSLQKLHRFGRNVVLDLERGYLTMFRQILAGLEKSTADIVFFCEHDILYHPSHFDFTPPRDDIYFYNENVWKLNAETGKALFHYVQQTSGLCADRLFLIDHYRKRVERVEKNGYTRNMGFEPGTHGRKERVDDFKAESWMSEYPNIDIRHKHNLTPSRWRKDQFRNQRFTKGWTESDEVPGWGKTAGRFDEILDEVMT